MYLQYIEYMLEIISKNIKNNIFIFIIIIIIILFVVFVFKNNKLRLFSQQEGIGESESEIPVDYSGSKFDITFNPDFISLPNF